MSQPERNLEEVDWARIPAPEDDGGADHLTGSTVPSIALAGTRGGRVNLATLVGRSVVYVYPMTGRPDRVLPDGWEQIPGARGCTPQSCAFRDHAQELGELGVDHLFGLSVQDPAYQAEAAVRLHLPFPLLSDETMAFAAALQLPTFEVEAMTLLKRVTLVVDDGRVTHTFYPVFPPDRNPSDVIDWLKADTPHP